MKRASTYGFRGHPDLVGLVYTSYAFGKRCREAGIMPSMGSVGDAYDNAMAESVFCHAGA
jgi:transposase InsO family protein